MMPLRDLQLRFQDYLINDSDAIEKDIVSTDEALAEHRLGAYYNAYRIRLIDCLAVDYAALQKHLGREAFENLALDYLRHYPSRHPSVRWFGQYLPEYFARVYAGEEREFLQELAAWEWSQGLVFDAADAGGLADVDDIASIPPADWPELELGFIDAMRWLDLHWNVPPYENALENDAEAPPLERGELPRRWLLWRHELATRWRSLDVHEAWALERAAAGAGFAEICEGLLEWVGAEQVALTAAGFLRQWVGDRLVTRCGKR